MTISSSIRQQERIVNSELARLLRERCNLDAQAEVIIDGRQPDVLVIHPNHGPIIIETEFDPARSVNDDALAKLGLEINGETTAITFAVTLPSDLREIQQEHLLDRLSVATISWSEWYIDSTNGPDISGNYQDLCEQIKRAVPRSDALSEAVQILERGLRTAAATIRGHEGTMYRISKVLDREPSDEVAHVAALMFINAMSFHDRISGLVSDIPYPPFISNSGNLAVQLRQVWSVILEKDYWPIFRTAYDLMCSMPVPDAYQFSMACRRTVDDLAKLPIAKRHDLAGQIFNRLVADRKFLAAFYTSIPAATLLASLALNPDKWPAIDWSDLETLKDMTVLDPACGTGTLLMAAYQQIAQNHRANLLSLQDKTEDSLLHKTLIEDTIHGADVVDAAIHLTGSTLASIAPKVTFERMNLHVMPLGDDEMNGPRLGSLDWLDNRQLRTLFSGAGEQVGALEGKTSSTIKRPEPKLVIANPPYRRHNSSTGRGEGQNRVFGHKDLADERDLAGRLSALLVGKPANQIAGLGSVFVVLADDLLEPGGRMAFVLPATSLSGTSWREIRQMLSEHYEVEYVVSSHDPSASAMSYDTSIAEILLIARKHQEDAEVSGRGRFINLWRLPKMENEAVALAGAINRAPTQVHRIDGPPVGGTPLLLGNDQWGEIVESPISSSPWPGSRWMHAACGQYAYSLADGELWTSDGLSKAADLPMKSLEAVAEISPYDLQIRGTNGAFDIYDNWDMMATYPAIWHYSARTHNGLVSDPNARLSPKPGTEYASLWAKSGRLHVTRDVGYSSNPICATITHINSLGVRTWFTLSIKSHTNESSRYRELALALWCNSTLGLLCHAAHSNRSQLGRGIGSRTMLRTLPTLDVRELADWQLEAAEKVFSDLIDVQFEPFYKCAVDANRIRLDERLIREVLGLDDDAIDSVAHIRSLLANEPSIYGNKGPELP